MHKMTSSILAGCCCALSLFGCFASSPTLATPVSYTFSGKIDEFNYHGSSFNPAAGDAFTGKLTFDANYTGEFFGGPWPTPHATLAWELDIGGQSYQQQIVSPLVQSAFAFGSELNFFDDMPGMSDGAVFFDQGILSFAFQNDFAGSIPAELPVHEFLNGWFNFGGGEGAANAGANMRGTINALHVVSEPTTLVLFGIGLLGCIVTRRSIAARSGRVQKRRAFSR